MDLRTVETAKDFEAELAKGMHGAEIMGTNGDTKHIWDPNKPEEVEAARALYNSLTGKGYTAFHATGKDGSQGDQMREFDPNAGRVIFVPRMVGG